MIVYIQSLDHLRQGLQIIDIHIYISEYERYIYLYSFRHQRTYIRESYIHIQDLIITHVNIDQVESSDICRFLIIQRPILFRDTSRA